MKSLRAFALCVACQIPTLAMAQAPAEPMRFISLDGGGMLELIPISLLEKIEDATGQPISCLVDGMMGSSSGGIVAAMLNTPTQQWDQTPKFGAAQIHASYVANGIAVFNMHAFINAALFFSGYAHLANFPAAAASFDKLLDENVGHVYLSHSLKPLMITAYNARTGYVDLFDSENARKNADNDMPLKHAIRATTALEFFFGQGTIRFNTSEPASDWIDAGRVGHNDPTAFLCDALAKRYPNRRIVVYSLGTGFGTSYRTRAYMKGLNPNIDVVRIEPNFNDRKGTYVRALMKYFTGSDRMAENADVNYLAAMPFSSYISYIEKKAEEVIALPAFKRMLADFVQ